MRIYWETARDLALRVLSILGDLLSRINLMWFVWWLAVGLTVAIVVLLVYFFKKTYKPKQRTPRPTPKATSLTQEEPAATEDWKVKRRQLLYGSVTVYVALVIAGFFSPKFLGFNLGFIALLSSVAHFFLHNLKTVNPDEWGLVIFLGRVVFSADEGWVPVPEPFCRLVKVPKGMRRVEFGSPFTKRHSDDPLDIDPDAKRKDVDIIIRQPFRPNFLAGKSLLEEYRGGTVGEQKEDELIDIPEAYRKSIELPDVTPKMIKDLADDPMHKEITPDLQIFFIFRIKRADIFYRRIDGKTVEEKITNAAYMIADQAKHAVQEVAGRVTLAIFRTNQGQINRRLRFRVEQILGEEHTRSDNLARKKFQEEHHPNLGIDLISLAMKDPGLPFKVNEALSLNTAAGYEKTAAITKAEGEAEASKLKFAGEGKGKAEAELARLMAVAEGTGAVVEMIEKNRETGEFVLKVEAAKIAITEGKPVIIPADLSAISAVLAAARNIPPTNK